MAESRVVSVDAKISRHSDSTSPPSEACGTRISSAMAAINALRQCPLAQENAAKSLSSIA